MSEETFIWVTIDGEKRKMTFRQDELDRLYLKSKIEEKDVWKDPDAWREQEKVNSGKWIKPPVFCGNSLVEGGFTGEYRSPAKSKFHAKVRKELNAVEELLVEKNEAYGNSALDPINVFSKANSVEQLKVRIDDKLNRLYHGKEYGQEDTITDLIGYLVLMKIAEKEQGEERN